MIKWIYKGKEAEGQLINVSVMELEKPPSEAIMVLTDSGKSYQWMVKAGEGRFDGKQDIYKV